MKKTLVLACIFIFVTGCNKEKKFANDLAGTWTVYKYILNSSDQTPLFQSRYIGDTISFTAGGSFIEKYGVNSDSLIGGTAIPDTLKVYVAGNWAFANQYNTLILTASSYLLGDSVVANPGSYVRSYTLFDLSASNVQLITDTSRIYMTKIQ